MWSDNEDDSSSNEMNENRNHNCPQELCVEVELFGNSQCSSVTVIAMVAFNSQITRISRRLHRKIGFPYCEDRVLTLQGNAPYVFDLSPFPMTVKCKARKFANYPFVNPCEDDTFYDLIIGHDLISQNPSFYRNFSFTGNPDPGPAFSPEHRFNYDVVLATSNNVPYHWDAFFEYDCSHSRAMARLAMNKKTRQLYAIYRSQNTIYRYASLPVELERMIEEKSQSLGRIMGYVREACPCAIMEEFPDDAILVEPSEYLDFFD